MRELRDQELEEAVQLVAVAAQGRRQRRGVDVRCLERAHVELQAVAEALDAAEHPHRVALGKAAVEQLDVVPDARLDAARRVDELECEVRRSRLRPQLALRLHGVDGLDDPVFRKLRDRHRRQSTAASRHGSRSPLAPRRPRRGRPSAAFRRQPNAPPRSAAVSSPADCEHDAGELLPGGFLRWESAWQRPLARDEIVRDRAPGPAVLDEVRAREEEPPVERSDALVDLLLLGTEKPAQLRTGQRPFGAHGLDDPALEPFRLHGVGCGEERGHEPRRHAGDHAGGVLADAHEPACGQVVLRPPEEAHLLRPADEPAVGIAHRPVLLGAAVHLFPERGQHDVGLGEEQGEADAIDPRRGLFEGTDACHPNQTRLTACRP